MFQKSPSGKGVIGVKNPSFKGDREVEVLRSANSTSNYNPFATCPSPAGSSGSNPLATTAVIPNIFEWSLLAPSVFPGSMVAVIDASICSTFFNRRKSGMLDMHARMMSLGG